MLEWVNPFFTNIASYGILILFIVAGIFLYKFYMRKNFLSVVILFFSIAFLWGIGLPWLLERMDVGLYEVETTAYRSSSLSKARDCLAGRECERTQPDAVGSTLDNGAEGRQAVQNRVLVDDPEACWLREVDLVQIAAGNPPSWGTRISDWLPKGHQFDIEVNEPDFKANFVDVMTDMMAAPVRGDSGAASNWKGEMVQVSSNAGWGSLQDVTAGVVAGTSNDWPPGCYTTVAADAVSPTVTNTTSAPISTTVCQAGRDATGLPFYTWKADGTPGADGGAPQNTELNGESIGSPPSMFCKTGNGGMILTSDLP